MTAANTRLTECYQKVRWLKTFTRGSRKRCIAKPISKAICSMMSTIITETSFNHGLPMNLVSNLGAVFNYISKL